MTDSLYDTIGQSYSEHRRPDPRIAAYVERALGDARTVVNIGAGTGSYESADRSVVAVEPSMTMIRQRNAGPVVQALSEAIPFVDNTFDAATAFITIHHWSDWRAACARCSAWRAASSCSAWTHTCSERSGSRTTSRSFTSTTCLIRAPTMSSKRCAS